MLFSKWIYPKYDAVQSRYLQESYGLSSMLCDILSARNYSESAIYGLLNDEEELESPFLLPDMEQAVSRIENAIDRGERIAVYGDYDCDGITSTVLLYTYFQSMGADVIYAIPERDEEGYGLNNAVIDWFSQQGVTLIVTVDNGISALEEIAYATSLGMQVVVTDHHQPGDRLPAAAAVVDPHRRDYSGEFRDLCGAGVAFKLITAMEGGDYAATLDSFGALTAVATIGDVVSLTGENRYLVKYGLSLLKDTDNLGLQALMEVSGLKKRVLDSQAVAFGIVPRINAAGRMGKAKLAAQLLLEEDYERALELARELEELNAARKAEEENILGKITKKIEESPGLLHDRVMVLPVEKINHGVVGIVSARLVSLYGKPNIILSIEDGMAVGSARSVEYFSLFKAISYCSHLLEKYGGHTMAAGLTLQADKIPEFTALINEYAEKNHEMMPVPSIKIDKELKIKDINLEEVSALSVLEPFGENNPRPVFLLRNCVLQEIIPLSENRHLKLKVSLEGKSIFILYFKMSREQFIYPVGSSVDILANLELSTFRQNKSIAIKLLDIRPSGFSEKKFFSADYYYQKIRRKEYVDPRILTISIPSVEELRQCYKFLRGSGKNHLNLTELYLSAFSKNWNYCKYRLTLDILENAKLIRLPADHSGVELLAVSGKTDIQASPLLQELNQMKQRKVI